MNDEFKPMHLTPHRPQLNPISFERFAFRDADARLKRRFALYGLAALVLVSTWFWGGRNATLIAEASADDAAQNRQAFALTRAEAIRSAPGSTLDLVHSAVRIDKAAKRDLAIQLLEEATRRDPPNRDAQLQLAYLYLQDGRLTDAEPVLEHARRLDPIYPVTYELLATLYQAQGKSDTATQMLTLAKRFEKVPSLTE